jgi:RNA polymerase sigma factor (sigma-70 family)
MSETEQLIIRVREGDPEAFTALDALHRTRILRSLSWDFRDRPDDLEDAVQEALTYAFEQIRQGKLAGPQTNGGFRAYLAKIARRKLAEQGRRRRAKKRGAGHVALFSEMRATTSADLGLTTPDAGPGTAARDREREERLLAAIGDLPERHREAIDMRFNLQMSYREIAADAESTEFAAKALCHRALKRLRESLPELAADGD